MPPKPPSIGRALTKALKENPPGPEDIATVALARRLAAEIDAAESPAVLDKLTPRLVAVLAVLRLTPASRAQAAKVQVPDATTEGEVLHVGRNVVAEQRAKYGPPR